MQWGQRGPSQRRPSRLAVLSKKKQAKGMLSEHWGRIGELSENLNKETRTIKKSQSEMRTTITEIKDTLKGIDSQINEPKD